MLKNHLKLNHSSFAKLWHFPRHMFWLVLWCGGLIFLLIYLLRWGPGDHFMPVRLMNYFLPWWLIVLIPATLLAALTKRLGLTVVMVIPTVGIIISLSPLFIPTASPALADTPPLKIMSYNILFVNKTPDAAIEVIKREQADVILLQEITSPMLPALQAVTASLYPDSPGYIIYVRFIGQAIISRYPLKPVSSSFEEGRVLKAIVETPQGDINIWNVHPSTAVSQERWNRQHGQIVALTQAISDFKGGPLIVGGDFNTTPQSDNFQLVAQYLRNAHREGGHGFGFSFPAEGMNIPNKTIGLQWKLLSFNLIRGMVKWLGAKPEPLFKYHKNLQLPSGSLVRIDQIFYNDHFAVRQAQTLSDSGGSDHLPIIAELVRIK